MQYKNKVEICGIDTSSLKVLKEDKKLELIIRAHNGDKSARDEMIQGNLKLVLSVIQRFSNRGEPFRRSFPSRLYGAYKGDR